MPAWHYSFEIQGCPDSTKSEISTAAKLQQSSLVFISQASSSLYLFTMDYVYILVVILLVLSLSPHLAILVDTFVRPFGGLIHNFYQSYLQPRIILIYSSCESYSQPLIKLIHDIYRRYVERSRTPPQNSSDGVEINSDSASAIPPVEVKGVSTKDIELKPDFAICLVDFDEGDRCRILTHCKHMFHDGCVEPWLEKVERCPKCRSLCCQQSNHIICFSSGMTLTKVGFDVV